MKDKCAEGSAKKKRNTKGQDIRIINVAAVSFAVVSWFATALGLKEYVFDSLWQASLVSFGIQGILFVFNLKLPERFHQLGEIHSKETRNQFWAKVFRGFIKVIFVLFYSLVIVSSSLFSFVYICDQVVYHHQSGYADDNTLLASKYNTLLQKTEEYIEEDIKAVQMLASIQLSDLLTENPQILGELTNEHFRTEKEIDAEISQRKNELKKKQVDEITAQDNYKNAQNDYEALYGERYVRPVEFKEIQDRRDELRKKLSEATKEVTDLENMISDLEKEKRDLENSPNMKSVEFLTMFLETNPSPNKLQECINELQSMVINMQDGSIVPTNLANIVRKIRALSITIEDYSALKGNGNKSAEEILDSLRESYAEGISAPDPKSEYFETERKKWKKEWTEKYEKLQRLIRSLPRYHESGAEEKLVNAQIDTTILTSFDPDGKEDEINTMIREKLSDINVMERASSLLFSKYRFSAIFSACLAFYLDIVSLLCGLFSYYLKRNQKMKADT